MKNKILYKKSVYKDISKIDYSQQLKLTNRIEKELAEKPGSGKKLTGEFTGLYSLRIGTYRVIYTQISGGVLILRIAHRKEVYR